MGDKGPVTTKEFQEFADFAGENFERVQKQFTQIDKRFEQVDKRFDGVDRRLGEFREEVKEEISEKFDKIMTGIDGVVKELQAYREEDVAGAAQLRRHDDHLLDHEKRIVKLEAA